MVVWVLGGIVIAMVVSFLVGYSVTSNLVRSLYEMAEQMAQQEEADLDAAIAIGALQERSRLCTKVTDCFSWIWLLELAYLATTSLVWYVAIPIVLVTALLFNCCFNYAGTMGTRVSFLCGNQ